MALSNDFVQMFKQMSARAKEACAKAEAQTGGGQELPDGKYTVRLDSAKSSPFFYGEHKDKAGLHLGFTVLTAVHDPSLVGKDNRASYFLEPNDDGECYDAGRLKGMFKMAFGVEPPADIEAVITKLLTDGDGSPWDMTVKAKKYTAKDGTAKNKVAYYFNGLVTE